MARNKEKVGLTGDLVARHICRPSIGIGTFTWAGFFRIGPLDPLFGSSRRTHGGRQESGTPGDFWVL